MMLNWSPDELKAALDQNKTVFLKLWKKGCGACKLSEPALERLEPQFNSLMTFAQIQTDLHPEILEIAESEVLPMFFVFQNQRMKGSMEGFKGLERLKSFIEDCLNSKDSDHA